MGFLKKLFVFVVILVVLFVAVGFFLPKTVHVERSTQINAPKCTIFAAVSGYKNFNQWSPWAERDPNATYEFEGPDYGVGAEMSWSSEQKDVGSGSQKIVETKPFESVKVKLDFGEQGVADSFFKLEGTDSDVKVTWGFDTDLGNNIIGRYFGLMLDKWIGPDYELGLANLKKWVESLPKTDFSELKAEVVDVESYPFAYVSTSAGMENDEISQAIGAAYGKVGDFIGKNNLQMTGQPITINTSYGEDGYKFDAGIPIDAIPIEETQGEVKIGKTYGGKVIKVIHRGSYHNLSKTYAQIDAFLKAYGFETTDRPWDQYISDPTNTPEEEVITHIFFPVK